ncbi:MAG: serine/threonine protein kinase [Acidobacteria bacterium]|nr:serine/threonine protein kinase [Acidobacteriota bacterium]
MIGKTLGHYQITGQIGKGGMGEVYRAKDQKLGREVAVKVLPEEFTSDTDRIARFQREAKLLASLNHPNIAAIHGLEESGGIHFLVLELVEGKTLADRIKEGLIPVAESLELALQITEALESAHEKGVIHRDLKPANIKVTPEGKAKVLDFGLAKAFAGEQAELSNSPTISFAATQQGVILGTAAYMSPEQARGKSVDKRTDIWAFGCVLFEMLTGQPAFQGEDVTEVLAAVVKLAPNLELLPAEIHPRVRETLACCLQKDLKKRYRDIGDVRLELEKALADHSGTFVQPSAAAESHSKMKAALPWIAASILAMAVVGLVIWNLRTPGSPQVTRFYCELPEGQQFFSPTEPVIAVSPNGKQFVYSTTKGLYLRSLGELDARLIPGTENESIGRPFFSPDGRWIGYWSQTDLKLKKIAVGGGASWDSDKTIIYSDLLGGGIMRVPASGGTPEYILKMKLKDISDPAVFPQLLPDGKSVLFTKWSQRQDSLSAHIMIRTPESGEPRQLFEGYAARYLPTGHIIYAAGTNILGLGGHRLFAVPFDLGSKEEPLRVWVGQNGKEEPSKTYPSFRISPDGSSVAMSVQEVAGNSDIWVWNPIRGTRTKLTREGRSNSAPVWSPDGKRVAYLTSTRGSNFSGDGVYLRSADGTGMEESLGLVTKIGQYFTPYCWSRDGKILIGAEGYQADIAMLSAAGDHAHRLLLKEEYVETQPAISPNGRWIVYASNESQSNEVYVRPFPDVDKGRWPVSASGGENPLWSPQGHELFYRSGDAVMAVSIKTEPGFDIVGKPRILFRGVFAGPWDISPDGKRFLMVKPPGTAGGNFGAEAGGKINVILNWFEELKQSVPLP